MTLLLASFPSFLSPYASKSLAHATLLSRHLPLILPLQPPRPSRVLLSSAVPHRSLVQPPSSTCTQRHFLIRRISLLLFFPHNPTSPDDVFLKEPHPKPMSLLPGQPLVSSVPPVWSGGCWRQELGTLCPCKGKGGDRRRGQRGERMLRAWL